MANTLGDLQTRVLNRLDNNALLYTQPELTTYANEAQRILNLFTGLLQVSVYVPGSSQTRRVWYDTPSPIYVPFRVNFEGRSLMRISLDKMGDLYPQWTQENTDLVGYPTSHWAPCGLSKFGIHPADSLGGNDMLVTGLQEPSLLVNVADTIPFPNEYLEALEDLTAFSIQLKEGWPIANAAMMLFQKFMAKVMENKRWRNLEQPAYEVQRTSRR